jgi:hypothetical protein
LQLSAGLSTEYARKASEEKEVSEKDADNNIAAKYYVQQILGMDEGSIQQAWTKVSVLLDTNKQLCCCDDSCN